jgi:hypothetical protein
MNKLLISLLGALTVGATLPVVAGPDWQAIEKARQAKQATQISRHGDPYEAAGPTAAGRRCPAQPLVLLLDHGPRAQTTPYQNQQRQARYEAELKACEAATK